MYFGKQAKNLTSAESALLAALPQAPTYYSPNGSHTDALVARQRHILDLMLKAGKLTKPEWEEARAVDVLKTIQPRRESIRAPHFVFFVREYLTKKYLENTVEQGGLKVITTLDWRLQEIAEDVVKNGVPKYVDSKGGDNTALVSEDPHTGQILAMVGSRDYFDSDHAGNLNHATRPRQPGSSFKPIVYATAFKMGYTPRHHSLRFETGLSWRIGKLSPTELQQKGIRSIPMETSTGGLAQHSCGQNPLPRWNRQRLGYGRKTRLHHIQDRSRFGLALVLGEAESNALRSRFGLRNLCPEGIRHPTTGILALKIGMEMC